VAHFYQNAVRGSIEKRRRGIIRTTGRIRSWGRVRRCCSGRVYFGRRTRRSWKRKRVDEGKRIRVFVGYPVLERVSERI